MIETSKLTRIHTLGELKASGYQPLSVKDELRKNLIHKLQSGETIFSNPRPGKSHPIPPQYHPSRITWSSQNAYCPADDRTTG